MTSIVSSPFPSAAFAVDTIPRPTARQSSLVIPPKSVKKVQFADHPVAGIYSYDAIERDDVPNLFYSRSEQRGFVQAQRRLAQEYATSSSLMDSIYVLYGHDLKKMNAASMSSSSNNNNNTSGETSEYGHVLHSSEAAIEVVFDSDDHDLITPAQAQTILSESESRGLEPSMTTLISSHRQWAVGKLLEIQDRCQRHFRWQCRQRELLATQSANNITPDQQTTLPDGLSADEHEKEFRQHLEIILHVWSRRVSAVPRNYAHQLALGDEQAARRVYQEEPLLPALLAAVNTMTTTTATLAAPGHRAVSLVPSSLSRLQLVQGNTCRAPAIAIAA